ncbi:hypothetical protein FJT64_019890 [Amphibalanus amphitrite]|uniref:Mab-21-like HhH/H2TH-like domain-containing protein n=1 Tax=Amphibalanus amphitrite TaxID=1232801 RepID=A0A6A4WSC0_AMPAM|nr:hypothetical protein FJT64_019890 [Amphibalanus amphitrite]
MKNKWSDPERRLERERYEALREEKTLFNILAMTRGPQTCQTDLSGEVPTAAVDAAMAVSPGDEWFSSRPAAALVAALQAVPQTDKPELEGSRDDVFAEEDNHSLYREALITSADERIAALRGVLDAPENDPAEMAAARAALARSKAYPKLDEWRPFEEISTREIYRSVLGGGVLPSEEACVLALYRDLLNGGEPGEAECSTSTGEDSTASPECSTSTGEDSVDKEELRHELKMQEMFIDKSDILDSLCRHYPKRVSDEFVNRERPSGQPSKALVKKLSEMPIYLVGKGVSYENTFRMSFSRLESEVIRSMTKPQRICLILLKHCAALTDSWLSSYELKTAMMWVCERRAPELWTWDGMLESMRAVLQFLLECAENDGLRCYFSPEIKLRSGTVQLKIWFAVSKLLVLLPRAIQLLLAGLLSSSQAPLMRHLLNLPLNAQQMLWCCWKRRVDDPYPTHPDDEGKIDPEGLCCLLYPAAVEGRLWSERFLDTFRWESLPARCREPDWFAEHGWDTDSEGEEEEEDREDTDSEGEEEEEKVKEYEGEEEYKEDKDGEGEEEDRKHTDGEEEEEKVKECEGEEEDREGGEEEIVACSKMSRIGNVLGRALRCLRVCGQCINRNVNSTNLGGRDSPVSNRDGQINMSFISPDGYASVQTVNKGIPLSDDDMGDRSFERAWEESKNIEKVLAMTRRPRTCQTDLSGEVPAAAVDAAMAVSPGGYQYSKPAEALVAALRAVPQIVRPRGDESILELDSLSLEALNASADERIAALTRVLKAPDDDPAEMAAARAALARSKAYPKLEEWRPFEEVSTRETYRSVLGGGVLPSEEACVLALYRDLLNGGEPGEAECNTSTGEDTVATGKDSTASPEDIVATGKDSTSTGGDTVATGEDTVATGEDTVATGEDTVATGEDSTAKAECSMATGEDTVDKEELRIELEAQKIHRYKVIFSMTKPQRICLVLLKHCGAVTGSRLCSYDLKTAMMWVCERRAPELWTWDGMLESMMAVLDFLLECAERGALPCYFSPEINLWNHKGFDKGLAVLRLRVLLPRAIQLLLAGLLSSSQAPLMRHLLNLPLDAQQMLWCCWKRRIDDPYPTDPKDQGKINPNDLCSGLYPAAVEGRLWSERFLETFRWESLPARCREPDWFAEHGWDTDSEGEGEEHREDKDGEGKEEEEDREDTDGEGDEEGAVTGAMKTGSGSGDTADTAEQGGEEARKRDPDIDEERADYISLDGQTAPDSKLAGQAISNSASLDGHTTSDSINLDGVTTSDSSV